MEHEPIMVSVMRVKEVTIELLRSVFLVLFLSAGVWGIWGYERSLVHWSAYWFIPLQTRELTLLVPFMEIGVAFLLSTRSYQFLGYVLASAVLLILYIAATLPSDFT